MLIEYSINSLLEESSPKMNLKDPTISVVMPVWDRELYLREAVDSILSQSFTDFELILVADGTGPEVSSVLEQYALSDDRVRLYRLPCNMGVSAAKNVGIRMARGRYMAWMDSDDVAMPERLARQFEYLEANQEVELCCSDAIKILQDGQEVRMNCPEKDGVIKAMMWLVHGGAVLTPTAMMRSGFITQKALYHSSQFPRDLDHVHYIDMIRNGGRFYCIQEPLLRYRRHGGNVTSNPAGVDEEKRSVRMLLLPLFFPELTSSEGRAMLALMNPKIQVTYIEACQGVAAVHKAMQERRSFYGEDRKVLNSILSNLIQRLQKGMLGK